MARIQVGVIGFGRMGAVHARHLAGPSPAPSWWRWPTSIRGGWRLAEELGVKGYLDFREMIAVADVDAIVVAGPTDQREAMLEAAIASGKPIFCEKPLGPDDGGRSADQGGGGKSQARFCSWALCAGLIRGTRRPGKRSRKGPSAKSSASTP